MVGTQYLVGRFIGPRRERSAQRRQDLREEGFSPVGGRRFYLPAPKGFAGPVGDELGGPVYGLDGAAVALLVGVTPGYEAVLGEQDELRVGVVRYGLPYLLA